MWRSFLSVIKEPMLMHVRVLSTAVITKIYDIFFNINSRYIETGMLIFIDRVADDFFG